MVDFMNDETLTVPYEPEDVPLAYSDFLVCLKKMSDIDHATLKTEAHVLNCGFKPFDFTKAATELDFNVRKAERLFGELCDHERKRGCPEPVTAAREYLACLIATSGKMAFIARRLGEQAKGEKFGFFEYRREIKEYRKLSKQRKEYSLKLETAQHEKW